MLVADAPAPIILPMLLPLLLDSVIAAVKEQRK
jgi:hypothetical protein